MRAAVFATVVIGLVTGGVSSIPERNVSAQEAPPARLFAMHASGERLPLYDLSQVHPTNLVRPEYPKEEKEKKLAGEAIVRVLVTSEGKIESLEIRKSDPTAAIGESAKKAVSQWHFPRVVKDGVSISYFIDVPVVFAPPGTPIAQYLKKRPNKAPEPTRTSVTPRAGARVAPAARVAHL
jgi:protein TonB